MSESMGIDDEVGALSATPIFRSVDPARLRVLALSAERVQFAAGQRIYAVGEASEDVLFILKGTARTQGGIELPALVGHIGTLLERPRMRSVYAQTEIMALRLGRTEFVNVLLACGQLSLSVILDLARLLDDQVNRQTEGAR